MKAKTALFAIFAWICTSIAVFLFLDAFATRPVPIYVEDYRPVSATDDEAVTKALQAAYQIESNGWWIRDKTPILVFDPSHEYDVHPAFYTVNDLHIVAGRRGTLGHISATSALMSP